MGRKGADATTLARALKAPAFGTPSPVSELEPVSPATLVLPVAKIKRYERNPRRAENHEYPRLKDSIRSRRGVTTPLTVTKRPGETLYMIAAGGNSRLRALQELAEETNDDAFAHVTCRFEPWRSECHVFASHLIENDVRGAMTFGDKARAVAAWQRLYEESHPQEAPLTQRDLADRLAKAGYVVPRTMIAPWLRTAEYLLPHLPIALGSGLGRPAAERLLRLRDCALAYWRERAARAPNAETFETLFADVCAANDGHAADWDPDRFQGALIARIASALGIDRKLAALDIDGLYHGCPAEPEAREPDKVQDSAPATDTQWVFARAKAREAARRMRTRTRREHEPERRDPPTRAAAEVSSAAAPRHPVAAPGPTTVAELRADVFAAAEQLATPYGIDPYLRPVNVGFGFFLEPPEPAAEAVEGRVVSAPGEGLVLSGLRSTLWWLLCFAADQRAPAHRAALAAECPESWWIELMDQLQQRDSAADPIDAVELLAGRPTPCAFVSDLLTDPEFTDEAADALMRLLNGCRRLRALALAGRCSLWEAS